MSQTINARDVLKCLNELGYTGVDACQLKQFIKDLKILIKHDSKLQNLESSKITNTEPSGVDHDSGVTKDTSFVSSRSVNDERSLSHNKTNVFDYLYTKETIASEAKRTKSKENVISVQIRRPNRGATHHSKHVHCIHSSHQADCASLAHQSKRSKSESDMLGQNSSFLGHEMSSSNVGYTATYSNISGDTLDDDKGSSYAKPHKSRTTLRPKASFIRPKFGKSFKTDPVALYHQYQEEWKKRKVPGEDNRADLRWAIRERMLGDVGFVQSSESISKRRPHSCQA